MGSMTENIADKAINDTRIVKQFTNPVKEPIDSDINLFDLLDHPVERRVARGDAGFEERQVVVALPGEALGDAVVA